MVHNLRNHFWGLRNLWNKLFQDFPTTDSSSRLDRMSGQEEESVQVKFSTSATSETDFKKELNFQILANWELEAQCLNF